jgi:hypothetical protein
MELQKAIFSWIQLTMVFTIDSTLQPLGIITQVQREILDKLEEPQKIWAHSTDKLRIQNTIKKSLAGLSEI